MSQPLMDGERVVNQNHILDLEAADGCTESSLVIKNTRLDYRSGPAHC